MMDRNTESSSVSVQPETDFAEFYYGVISKLYDLKNRQILFDVKSALRDIRRLKSMTDNFLQRTHFSFKPPPVRCAYLYAYSVLHSIMVYSEFSNLLKKSKMFLLPACRRDVLKICCLGGGPGIEAVAICRSLYDIILGPYSTNLNSLLEVHVTMIDKLPHWRREESVVVNAINDSSNVLHSERINLHSDFMKADLLKPFEKALREKIKEADIVTVVKLAISIQETSLENCDEEFHRMMENIVESMQDDSCLFMLDASGGKIFYNMVKSLRDKEPHSQLKISKHKEYNLDVSTIKKLKAMMELKKVVNYRPALPTVKGKVSACMWAKNISILSENCKVPKKINVNKTSNISKSVYSTVQSDKDTSLTIHSDSVPKILNEDVMVPTDNKKNTEFEKKSKRARKKEKKCTSNQKA